MNNTTSYKDGDAKVKNNGTFYWLIFSCLLLAALGLGWLICLYLRSPLVIHQEWGGPEQFGQFGDMIGGILNPILTFITICILIYNSYTQDKSNKHERNKYETMLIDKIIDEKKHELQKLVTQKFIKFENKESGEFFKFNLSELDRNKNMNKNLSYVDGLVNKIKIRNKEAGKYTDFQSEELENASILYDARNLLAEICKLTNILTKTETSFYFTKQSRTSLTDTIRENLHMGIIQDIEFFHFLREIDNPLALETNFINELKN